MPKIAYKEIRLNAGSRAKSWELDALEPKVITALIEKTVLSFRDEKKWKAAVAKQEEGRDELREVARNL